MNVPKLRFSNYDNEWSYEPLNKYVSRIVRKNKDNESDLVLTISAQYGLVDQCTFFNRNVSSSNLSSYYLLYNGDFAYNKSYSNGYPWGAVKRLNLYDKGVVSSLYICFSLNDNINSDYLQHYFETNKWYSQMSTISVEGARNHGLLNISVKDFFNTEHFIPSLNEQTKISKFLNLLDKEIELQSKKIEDLKLYKKGLINRIMKSIKEEKKIRDICIYENGNSYEDFVNENGNYKLISLNSIDINGNLKNNIKKIVVDNPKTLLKNDIVMVLSDVAHGDFLGISTIIPNNNEYVLNQRMGLLRIFDDSNPKFIVNAINSNQKQFKTLGQGSSQLNLSKDDILNVIIKYPDINTQNKYGIIFDKLEKYIYLNESKLNKLIRLKKGLMQSMFV